MNIEQLQRAQAIKSRLRHIQEVQERLAGPHRELTTGELCLFLAHGHGGFVSEADAPAPVRQFMRACLDALATEKAVLEAEFSAL